MIYNLPSSDATPETSALTSGAQRDSREIITSDQPLLPAGHSPSPSAVSASSAVKSLLFAPTDPVRFGRLPESARDDLSRTFKALEWIHTQVTRAGMPVKKACRIMALKCMNAPGFTEDSLRRKYYDFLKARGDWTVLVNKSKAGVAWWKTDEPIGLPPAFVEFWKTLCDNNQRKCKPAHRELLKIWRTRIDTLGKTYPEIPGYADWPQSGPCGTHPLGWSYDNLQRLYSPDDFELTAARQGLFAASKFRRKVFTTRVGLSVGEVILFDDQVYDHKVIFTSSAGQAASRRMRPRGYNAIDLFSARFIGHLFKPTLLNPDDPHREQHLSSKKEMVWFVAEILTRFGYRPVSHGTTFVLEHGTAAIARDFEERIYNLTGGCVVIERSGLLGRTAHAGLFEGRGKGNPRFKGALESVFGLVRNEMALLPGQVGKDRDHCPDQLHGAEKYDDALIRALPPEVLARARRPFHEWTEFVTIALDIFGNIDARIDHSLEGWGRQVAHEWRISPSSPWLPMSEFEALPVPQQMSLSELFRGPSGSQLVRVRKLSPFEVCRAGAKALQKLPLDLIPALLTEAHATARTVRGGYITLEDQELGPDLLRFPAYPLANGDTFLTYHLGAQLVLATKANAFVTVLHLQHTPCRLDTEGVLREMAAAKKEEAARLAPLQARHLQESRAKARMHAHNASLMPSTPNSPRTSEEKATDRAIDTALAENSPSPWEGEGRERVESDSTDPISVTTEQTEPAPQFDTQKDYE